MDVQIWKDCSAIRAARPLTSGKMTASRSAGAKSSGRNRFRMASQSTVSVAVTAFNNSPADASAWIIAPRQTHATQSQPSQGHSGERHSLASCEQERTMSPWRSSSPWSSSKHPPQQVEDPIGGDRASAQPTPLAHRTGHARRPTLSRKINAGRMPQEYREPCRWATEIPITAGVGDAPSENFWRGGEDDCVTAPSASTPPNWGVCAECDGCVDLAELMGFSVDRRPLSPMQRQRRLM